MSDEKEKTSETSEIAEEALEQVVGGISIPISGFTEKLNIGTAGAAPVSGWDISANKKS